MLTVFCSVKSVDIKPLFRARQLFDDPAPAHPNWPVPTPKPNASPMFAGLRELVQESIKGPTNEGPKGPRSGQSNMSSSQEFNILRG